MEHQKRKQSQSIVPSQENLKSPQALLRTHIDISPSDSRDQIEERHPKFRSEEFLSRRHTEGRDDGCETHDGDKGGFPRG